MAKRRKTYNKAKTTLEIVMLAGFMAVVLLVATLLALKANNLKIQEKEAIIKEEGLEKQISAEKERTEKLEEEKKYVKTDKYIEEVAKEKLGLINPGEVVFKEEE
ncbi:MAG: septum formation initiator family protein [Eubacteriales bacterium]|nr:septum formation initiator family protein [Eubacteriales bacterium]